MTGPRLRWPVGTLEPARRPPTCWATTLGEDVCDAVDRHPRRSFRDHKAGTLRCWLRDWRNALSVSVLAARVRFACLGAPSTCPAPVCLGALRTVVSAQPIHVKVKLYGAVGRTAVHTVILITELKRAQRFCRTLAEPRSEASPVRPSRSPSPPSRGRHGLIQPHLTGGRVKPRPSPAPS